MASLRSRKSTTVRNSVWALRRAAIRSIHPLAPRQATSLAARWFVTPSRMAGRPRGQVAASLQTALATRDLPPDPGTPMVLSDRRRQLAASSWGRGPLALMVHGWNGRGAQLAPIGRALAARGYRAVAFDHPAHGDSSGRTATIPDMADAIQMVSEQLGRPRALVAHSLGAVAATVAMSRGLEVGRAVFVAPPLRPERWISRFGRAIGLPASAEEGLRAAIEARAGSPVSALQPLVLAPALRTALLIVHDRSDREVPLADGEELASVWPEARLVVTEGLGHRRVLSSPATLEMVVDFIGDAPAHAPARPWARDPHFAAIVDQILAS
jgi:pimeloyl-ACP methyl ester carboxylesterase